MLRKLVLFLTLGFLLPSLLMAQDGKLRGKVTDKDTGEPLVGANVTLEGTNLGAAVDVNGDYVVLSVPAGVYSVKASYIGYANTTVSNVRVSAGLTTTQNFALGSSAVQVQAIEIVAERPLIQRNTTNTIRLTTQEDIANLPVRGTQNILALQAGVVQQYGNLYVRGGRVGEVAYYVDGTSVTNPLFNTENVSIIQEAIEELQLQSGGFTAEYGGANSGVVQTSLRTGGPEYKFSVDYQTDDFAKPGKEFLSTTARGLRNVVGTLSGPVPFINNLRFFVAAQNNYQRNRQSMFLTPFSFTGLTTDERDAHPGRLLPGPVAFSENNLPMNWRNTNTFQGTLLLDVKSLKFRLSGSYQSDILPGGANWPGALANIFRRDRLLESRTYTGLAALRMTHVLDPTTFYEVSASWQSRVFRNYDPAFAEQWWLYPDSIANAQKGFTGFTRRYRGPDNYSIINGFTINNEFAPNNNYQVNKQKGLGFTFDFTRQMNKKWELKLGGALDSYVMRLYNTGSISARLEYLNGTYGNTPRVFASDAERRIALVRQAGINNYGYTIDGVETDAATDAPKKPLTASAYVQSKFEFQDVILNAGLRLEYFDTKDKTFANPEDRASFFDVANDIIDESKLVERKPYQLLLPRISLSFPVTDRTVFFAQFGKYAQMPALNNIYTSALGLSTAVSPKRTFAYLGPVGWLAGPERTTSYEMGIRQSLTENFAFTLSGFYKDTKDQMQVRIIYDELGQLLYYGYQNDDFGTVKGVEMTLELRRTSRFAARANYTYSDGRGTGSNPTSTWGAVEQNVGRTTNYVYPLDFNQTHRGSVLLDYRWGLGEGGPILSGLGINMLFSFNSGHPYTQLLPLKTLGQASSWDIGSLYNTDRRGSYPAEPVNASSTPFVFDIGMNLSKMFNVGPLKMEVYVSVLNLLNSKSILSVYQYTGSAQDDGWLANPLSASFKAIPNYEAFYRAVNQENRWAYMNLTRFGGSGGQSNDLYGQPREIRVGLKLDI